MKLLLKKLMGRQNVINCVLFDLDGTIQNGDHRQDLIPDFEAYHRAHIDDYRYVNMCIIWKQFQKLYPIMILTGRSNATRETTTIQLKGWGLEWARLYMRQEDDSRPASILKLEWCRKLMDDNYNPVLAFDDDLAAVEIYKNAYISTMQVRML